MAPAILSANHTVSSIESSLFANVYYSDSMLNQDCLGNYSIAKRNCSGSDGYAFNTITKATYRLKPADTLLIREGVYREEVTLLAQGTSEDKKIKIAAYSDETVEINAANTLSNWTRCRNQSDCQGNSNWANMYYTNPQFKITQLFQNNKKLNPSRFPNRGWDYPTSIGSNSQSRFTSLNARKADNYFNEAIANIKTMPFWLSQVPISKSYSDGKFILENGIESYKGPISKKFGFYLTNIVEEINEAGEWAYDDSSKRLYLFPNAGLANIEASVRDYGILIVDTKYYEISGITVKYPNYYGVWILGSDNILVSNMEVDSSYRFGIQVQGRFSPRGVANYNKITGNTIKNSNYRGITNDSASHDLSITYNSIYATGTDQLGGDLTLGLGVALFVEGSNLRILNNVIDGTGYNGIQIGGTQRSDKEIAYNHISNTNLALTDGAGIYSGGKSNSGEFDYIHHNILENIYGYLGGEKQFSYCDVSPDPQKCSDSSQGIYIDENGNNFQLDDNTVINASNTGIYFHWTKNNTAVANILYGNKFNQIWLSGKNDPRYILERNYIYGNTLYSTQPDQNSFFLGVNYDSAGFGTSRNNSFLNIYNENNVRSLRYVDIDNRIIAIDERITLSEWQDLSYQETNTKGSLDFYESNNANNDNNKDSFILVNPTMQTKEFNLNESYCDLNGEIVSNSTTVDIFSAKILLKCFCNKDNICNNNEDRLSCSQDC